MSSESCVIQYVPFSSFVDPAFWHTLTRVKLDVDRLEQEEREIAGYYSYRDDMPAMLEVDGASFNSVPRAPPNYDLMPGTLIYKNTIESFKVVDKAELLNAVGRKHWEGIKTKEWIASPNKLLRFIILTFPDLKKFHYFYWFAFPVPSQPTVFAKPSAPLSEILSETQMISLTEGHMALDKTQRCFFAILVKEDKVEVKTLSEVLNENVEETVKRKDLHFGMLDSSNGVNPGWPLRNFVAALVDLCPSLVANEISVIGLRCKMNRSLDPSVCFKIYIPEDIQKTEDNGWVGWERNDQGKFMPKLVNMSSSMDPVKLAEDSADLNLKLMKWRLVPEIDLDAMKKAKCLLFGAGTLGCHVARNLLAWGFRNITFVDSGRVSYSNPVRQPLYSHKDCEGGGKMKAVAAAANLKLILPSVNSKGTVCHIPMPGHPVGESLIQETLESINMLTKAISEHDIIYLLLDTREARWLPTVIASHYNKIVINAALGFDSYLVMRHGSTRTNAAPAPDANSEYVLGQDLGCYFCSDVTAPGNSMKDRTLDQQCTVTRPGVAAIAGALTVEMTVSLLQHPLQSHAPAAYNLSKTMEHGVNPDVESILGAIPHSIRGFLWSHQTVTPTCMRFNKCVACSDVILNEYREKRTEFILQVLGDASYLEKVSGLTELHLAAEMIDMMTLSDDEAEEMTE